MYMPIKFLKNIKLAGKNRPDGFRKFVPAVLAHHIEGIYVFPCNDIDQKQLLFNDGRPSLIFMCGRDNRAQLVTDDKRMDLDPVWLCCGILENIYIDILGQLDYFLVIRFKPKSFYYLFGVPTLSFRSNPVYNFKELTGQRWMDFVEDVCKAETVEAKVDQIAIFLSGREKSARYPHLLEFTLDYIDKQKGNVSVQDVLKAIGPRLNYKWLHRNFLDALGLSPKKYISLQRFIYAYNDISQNANHSLMEAALNNGYYDHNHFLKDFKRYTGKPPSVYFNLP